jgi:uncharacterized protein (TIGR02421 family)
MGKLVSSAAFSHRALSPTEQRIRHLSDRLVEAQRPIRILDAVQWSDAVEETFFDRDAQELPAIGPDSYQRRPLPFVPHAKLEELRDIEQDVRRQLGTHDAPGQVLLRMCQEYREVVSMLLQRGTRGFSEASRRLYGSAMERPRPGGPPLAELGPKLLSPFCDKAPHACADEADLFDAPLAVGILAGRLKSYFGTTAAVRVQLSDGIVADAAAGCDYLKIRHDATFSARDLRVLEVHEGWVHLGTTLNGQRQPICTFLSKGPPSSTVTQEGLAVLTEVLSSASHPGRVRRLTSRLRGVALAEAGANFLEVYRFFLADCYPPRECYQHAMRIFRGSLPEGAGPFTKDICYSKGFVRVSDFLRSAVQEGQADRVPLLFCGKTTVDDMGALASLVEEGLVVPPMFVPPPFLDLHQGELVPAMGLRFPPLPVEGNASDMPAML